MLDARTAELRNERRQTLLRALAITEQPQLTVEDRRTIYELLELAGEIDDYAARLTRQKEKWRTK